MCLSANNPRMGAKNSRMGDLLGSFYPGNKVKADKVYVGGMRGRMLCLS